MMPGTYQRTTKSRKEKGKELGSATKRFGYSRVDGFGCTLNLQTDLAVLNLGFSWVQWTSWPLPYSNLTHVYIFLILGWLYIKLWGTNH